MFLFHFRQFVTGLLAHVTRRALNNAQASLDSKSGDINNPQSEERQRKHRDTWALALLLMSAMHEPLDWIQGRLSGQCAALPQRIGWENWDYYLEERGLIWVSGRGGRLSEGLPCERSDCIF